VNIDILCSSRELFGADRSALRLAEALRSIDTQPTLVLPANRPEFGLSREASRRGIAFREDRIAIVSSQGLETPTASLPILGSSGADLSIFNSTAVLGSNRHAAKKMVVVREWLRPNSPRHRALALRHRLGANAVVGVSSDVVRQWRKCIRGPARQHVIHNWLDRSILDRTAKPPAGKARTGILCIGRFNHWKGQETLADAYAQTFSARTDRPALRFVGAQQGTGFDVRAAALRERGEDQGWEVLPFTSDPADHFWSAALVVVPSLQPEPFGTVVLEAIAHGCRVVAFEGGGPSDMARDFPHILELAPRTTGGLAAALVAWWDMGGAGLSVAESSQARGTLESYYSPQAGAAAWRKAIETLIP
jgi:glycosyltransferase involved in cell wall biosynthesis